MAKLHSTYLENNQFNTKLDWSKDAQYDKRSYVICYMLILCFVAFKKVTL